MDFEQFMAQRRKETRELTRGGLMVIAIDMDGVLCENNWHAEDPKPLVENIKQLNQLADANFIIVYTARPDHLYEVTKRWLIANGVRFHTLEMGKLCADVYIDDKAWNPAIDQVKGCQCHTCLGVKEPYP